MKKKLSTFLLTIFLIFTIAGCSTTGKITAAPQQDTHHKVDITLTNMDKEAITAIIDSDIDWDKPGILKPSQLLLYDEDIGKAWFKVFSGISVSDTTRFKQDLVFLKQKTKVRDIILMVNSPGGSAFDGLAFAGLIKDAQKQGFRISAEAYGIVASAAVPIFAQCRPRSAVEGTIFMVHEAAIWKWPGRETSSDIRAQNELMRLLSDRYIRFLVENSKLSADEWLLLEAKTSWFGTEKAKDYGLID